MSETKQKEKKGNVKISKPAKEDVRKAVISTIAAIILAVELGYTTLFFISSFAYFIACLGMKR